MQRPKNNETEEDLLKQQTEYLKHCQKNSLKQVNNVTPSPERPTDSKPFSLLRDVVEKPNSVFTIKNNHIPKEDGFPSVFMIDSTTDLPRSKKRKSLFAQKFEKRQANAEILEPMEEDNARDAPTPNNDEIHKENVMKLKNMTLEEILDEKKSLEASMDPALLQFLKNRGANKSKPSKIVQPPTVSWAGDVAMAEVEDNLAKTMDGQWMDLDVIEPEKLKWIGDIPDSKALEPDQPYSARFDFSGNLQPFHTELDVRLSLHHHGEEPQRPGYTIQELYQLTRSTVLQQRIIALTTLANIITKTKMGYYDHCFEGALLHKLVEADVFFLLRFAMDDRATTAAAVHCLAELFVSRSDEVCLDRLFNVPGQLEEPYFYIPIEVDKDSNEQELRDDQIIAQDLIRGVLRTDLLVRFGYILNNFDLDILTVSKILDIVIRVCRHSPETGEKVLQCSSLVDFVFQNVDSSNPLPVTIKLFRVLSNCQKLAEMLHEKRKGDFNFIFRIIDLDEPVFKLKLECLNLWGAMLRHGLLLDRFSWFSSIIKRLVQFYVSTLDVDHGQFDFELFSGITSIFNRLASVKIFLDSALEGSLLTCLQKWMSQIISGRKWNFSVTKSLGCALFYFVTKFHHRGITPEDVRVLEVSFIKTLSNFLSCENFKEMSSKLVKYSHIILSAKVTRDPENLPSLCSIYDNGSDYLKLVQDCSAFALMPPLTDLVIMLSEISSSCKNLPEILLLSFENYVKNVLKYSETSSWFARTEVTFLLSLLKLKAVCCNSDAFRFAFRLIPFLRTDDQRILSVIKLITTQGNFPPVYLQYATKDFKPFTCHACETFPKHWMYEPIAAAPKETLKCLTYLIEKCSDLIANVPSNLRYVHLCLVLLNDENVFNSEISEYLEKCLEDVLLNYDKLELDSITVSEKSFYELYRDLVVEYAGSSYGHPLFAKVVTIPLAQKFDVSYRKLLWSEFIHALRVITLPRDVPNFIEIEVFTTPVETDESLLVLYLNAVSKNVLTETRNGFMYNVAVENVRKYLKCDKRDADLAMLLGKRISLLKNDVLKSKLLEVPSVQKSTFPSSCHRSRNIKSAHTHLCTSIRVYEQG